MCNGPTKKNQVDEDLFTSSMQEVKMKHSSRFSRNPEILFSLFLNILLRYFSNDSFH